MAGCSAVSVTRAAAVGAALLLVGLQAVFVYGLWLPAPLAALCVLTLTVHATATLLLLYAAWRAVAWTAGIDPAVIRWNSHQRVGVADAGGGDGASAAPQRRAASACQVVLCHPPDLGTHARGGHRPRRTAEGEGGAVPPHRRRSVGAYPTEPALRSRSAAHVVALVTTVAVLILLAMWASPPALPRSAAPCPVNEVVPLPGRGPEAVGPAGAGASGGVGSPPAAANVRGTTAGGTVAQDPSCGDPRRYFLAVNLFNNEAILPHFAAQLLALVDVLGRGRVFVSVFENGSSDDTPALMQTLLAAPLRSRRVAAHVVSEELHRPSPLVMQGHADVRMPNDTAHDRIAYLAAVRNRAMAPLWRPGGTAPLAPQEFTHVLFFNDVIWYAHDAVRLLQWEPFRPDSVGAGASGGVEGDGAGAGGGGVGGRGDTTPSTVAGSGSRSAATIDIPVIGERDAPPHPPSRPGAPPFDLACAMDYHAEGLYDRWVMRDVAGEITSVYYPHVRHKASAALLQADELVPMYACWNGLAFMNAEPFTKHGVRFRRNHVEKGECYGSECFFIPHDFRALGYNRIHMHPGVRVTYEWRYDWLYRHVMWSPVMRSLIPLVYSPEDDRIVRYRSRFQHYDNGVECVVFPNPGEIV